MNYYNYLYILLYFALFLIAQCFSMWGQFFILNYKNVTIWESYTMAIPYAWIAWLIMTYVVYIGNIYVKLAPQFTMMLLIFYQYFIINVINDKYLKQPSGRSDIICFIIILFAYLSSYFGIVSRILNIYKPQDIINRGSLIITTFNAQFLPPHKGQ